MDAYETCQHNQSLWIPWGVCGFSFTLQPMHLRDLTPVELADLLDAAYRQDRGQGGEGLDLPERVELADYLGCHPDVQAEAWEAWREILDGDEGEAGYWLDVEFVEPCPEGGSEF